MVTALMTIGALVVGFYYGRTIGYMDGISERKGRR